MYMLRIDQSNINDKNQTVDQTLELSTRLHRLIINT